MLVGGTGVLVGGTGVEVGAEVGVGVGGMSVLVGGTGAGFEAGGFAGAEVGFEAGGLAGVEVGGTDVLVGSDSVVGGMGVSVGPLVAVATGLSVEVGLAVPPSLALPLLSSLEVAVTPVVDVALLPVAVGEGTTSAGSAVTVGKAVGLAVRVGETLAALTLLTPSTLPSAFASR